MALHDNPLSAEQAAELLGISVEEVVELCRNGLLPCEELFGSYVIWDVDGIRKPPSSMNGPVPLDDDDPFG